MKPSPLSSLSSLSAFAALAAVLVVAGCASAPVYRLLPGRIHKDLVICSVQLSESLDVDEYARIARVELDGLLRSPVAAPEEDVPLYEARFEFLVSNPTETERLHKVATVRFALLSPDAPPYIILYPSVF